MVRYTDDTTVPVPRERLWRLLDLHSQDAVIPRIHPEVVSQETVSQKPGEYVVKRGVKVIRKVATANWKVTYQAPDRFRWEILDGNGPWSAGSYLSVAYSDVPGGTRMVSEGELTVVGLPGFLQNRIVRSALARVHDEDAEYLSQNP
ncbi:MAG TPA: SRPBCC family protein [Thermoplasmata archaeon]|nr:SRPBCC family protein [Thermoplasmata archaeon]